MIKREANFQARFNRYLRETKMQGAFELKQTRGNSLNYKLVPEHQIEGLQAVQENGFIWKLSDADPRVKPFDSISTPRMIGYIVIKFPGMFTIIKVDNFVSYRDSSKSKSINADEAIAIARYVVHL